MAPSVPVAFGATTLSRRFANSVNCVSRDDDESEAVTLASACLQTRGFLRPDEDQWQEEKGESDW